ncbi:AGC family protein kinase [Trichomonas vaginalis G3]|uniref:AGC family protein kinase n=1 Tax=Trichomonas vaginalis (strain ATCC PRA-98 / G3) TaxID=412133 RepID=A2FSN2_TRIV3|nr:protein serine/threonine kinase protein [Trichomonas vaginalis G3]EAX92088.1 AGC family protein kinase [Trichomonas vaginalis G3]KAI5550591.1 protein serine/threonine kinase protein [Trichomonas vaginalis G3]|eukprot:XP_001305018.1 AGC family protein kinase [Trichomonas vaginalis G3]
MSEIILDILNHRDYNFLGYINKGGFGCCYLVRSLKYNMNFVCKVVPDDDYDKSFLMSYKREVEALTKFNHPNIVCVYDVFNSNNFLFIILEYCNGGSLQDFIEKYPNGVNYEKCKQYANQIVDALSYMHNLGYAHCEIKPSNILIDEFGRVKLADFGLSHIDDFKNKSTVGPCGGSLCFMSPEILLNKSNDPFKSDIWVLGVTIYYLASSKIPFKGKNLNAILREIEFGPQMINDIPEDLWTFIENCLKIEPTEIPSSQQLKSTCLVKPNSQLSVTAGHFRQRHFSILSKQPVILVPFKIKRTSNSSVY